MNARAMSTLIRGDRLTVVAQALAALRRRTWAKRSKLDLETLEAACAVCEDRIVELERAQADADRARAKHQHRHDDLVKALTDVSADLTKSEQLVSSLTAGLAEQRREQEGQRSAFLSQVADLERRLAENLAAKLELRAENERLRHGQQAVAELADTITAALAAKVAPRARRK